MSDGTALLPSYCQAIKNEQNPNRGSAVSICLPADFMKTDIVNMPTTRSIIQMVCFFVIACGLEEQDSQLKLTLRDSGKSSTIKDMGKRSSRSG